LINTIMGAARDLWIKWKMLRLPWRKRFLIGTSLDSSYNPILILTRPAGQDLHGNTYWEFKDAINHTRWRRIVQASRKTHHSDVQISPQWHQWLRQTRADPPSIQEQTADLQRIAQMKQNARLADERWAAKAKYIEKPKPTSTVNPEVERAAAEQAPAPHQPPPSEKTKSAVETEDPWKKASESGSNPGATWTPEAWVPGTVKR
jgi:NADH dehydrogenase [ubiquinone] 1 alpha subcomplex assembly factor 2